MRLSDYLNSPNPPATQPSQRLSEFLNQPNQQQPAGPATIDFPGRMQAQPLPYEPSSLQEAANYNDRDIFAEGDQAASMRQAQTNKQYQAMLAQQNAEGQARQARIDQYKQNVQPWLNQIPEVTSGTAPEQSAQAAQQHQYLQQNPAYDHKRADDLSKAVQLIHELSGSHDPDLRNAAGVLYQTMQQKVMSDGALQGNFVESVGQGFANTEAGLANTGAGLVRGLPALQEYLPQLGAGGRTLLPSEKKQQRQQSQQELEPLAQNLNQYAEQQQYKSIEPRGVLAKVGQKATEAVGGVAPAAIAGALGGPAASAAVFGAQGFGSQLDAARKAIIASGRNPDDSQGRMLLAAVATGTGDALLGYYGGGAGVVGMGKSAASMAGMEAIRQVSLTAATGENAIDPAAVMESAANGVLFHVLSHPGEIPGFEAGVNKLGRLGQKAAQAATGGKYKPGGGGKWNPVEGEMVGETPEEAQAAQYQPPDVHEGQVVPPEQMPGEANRGLRIADKPLASYTVAELRDIASAEGIGIPKTLRKVDIVEAIERAQRERASPVETGDYPYPFKAPPEPNTPIRQEGQPTPDVAAAEAGDYPYPYKEPPNAVSQSGARKILQRQPEQTGGAGSQRAGMEPSQQGPEPAQPIIPAEPTAPQGSRPAEQIQANEAELAPMPPEALRSDFQRGAEQPVETAAKTPPEPIAGQADPDYEAAVKVVAETGRANIPLLQRKLGITYREAKVILGRLQAEGKAPAGKPDDVLKSQNKIPASRRGAVYIPNVPQIASEAAKGVVGAAKLAKKGIKGLADLWMQPMLDRVEAQGGLRAAPIMQQFRGAVDASRMIHGRLESSQHKVLSEVAGKSLQSIKATKELQGKMQMPGGWWASRMQLAVEGKIPLASLSTSSQQIIKDFRGIVADIGQEAVRLNVQVQEPNGQVRPFVPVKDGMRFTRSRTPEATEIMLLPNDNPLKLQWAKDRVAANPGLLTLQQSLQDINEEAEGPLFKRNAVEMRRVLPNEPAWVKDPKTGIMVEVLTSDPYQKTKSMVESSARRLGFIETVGQDLPNNPVTANIADQLKSYGVNENDAKDALRALNGIATEQGPVGRFLSRIAPPGTYEREMAKVLDAAYSLVKGLALTRAAIPNLLEPLTKTQAYGGIVPWTKAWISLALHPIQSQQLMASVGARTIDTLNWLARPNHTAQDVARIVSQVLTYPLKMVNELNELHAAMTGEEVRKLLVAGKGGDVHREMLKIFGFADSQITGLLNGTASNQEYWAVRGRFAERTQGPSGTSGGPALRSRLGNSPTWRNLVAFDAYGQMTVNRWAKTIGNAWEALKSGNPKRIVANIRLLSRMLFGAALAGAGTAFILALMNGGKSGVAIQYNEMKDDPNTFIRNATANVVFGGAAASVYNQSTNPQDSRIGGAVQGGIYPLTLLQEGADLYNGFNRYKDQNGWEKAQTFFQSRFAIGGSVGTLIASMGLSTNDKDRDTAIRAYYRWKKQYPGLNHDIGGDTVFNSETEQFRRKIKVLFNAMSEQDDKAQQAALEDALGRGDNTQVAQSIRGHELISKLDEPAKYALQKRIGQDAYKKLEEYDHLLESWASTVAFQSQYNKFTQQRHGSQMVEFGKMAKETEGMRRMLQGAPSEFKGLQKGTQPELQGQAKLVSSAQDQLGKLRQAITDVEADSGLSEAQKRREVRELDYAISEVLHSANKTGQEIKAER